MALKVLIAGGGIGGLTAACCLRKAGHAVEVFEQAPELAEIGAGIQLSANAMHVLNDLGLGMAIANLAVQPAAYVFRLHDSGEEIGSHRGNSLEGKFAYHGFYHGADVDAIGRYEFILNQ